MPHRISVKRLIAKVVALKANVVSLARWPILYVLLDIPGPHDPGGSMAYTNVWHLARWPLIVVALWLNYWSITCAVTHPTPTLALPCLTSLTVRH